MKNKLENIRELFKDRKNNPILFFGFYLVFFLLLFLFIHFSGDKNALVQEYEKGEKTGIDTSSLFQENFYYDYKINVDGIMHDYYGKKNQDVESFKYNNNDYYRNENSYFIHNGIWAKVDSPVIFSEFILVSNIDEIMKNATFISKTDLNDNKIDYRFLISSNTLNKILYGLDTDYDDIANEIVLHSDSNTITGISYSLNSFCQYHPTCQSLTIDLSYEMFGKVTKIDNPIE